jgi:hypothetical protein
MPRSKKICPPGPKPTFNKQCICEIRRLVTFHKQMAKWLAEQAEWQLYLSNREIIQRFNAESESETLQWILCELERRGTVSFTCNLNDDRQIITALESLTFVGDPEMYPQTKYNFVTLLEIKKWISEKIPGATFEEKKSCMVIYQAAYYTVNVTIKNKEPTVP